MSSGFRRLTVVGILWVFAAVAAHAQQPVPPVIVWLGQMNQTSSSAIDPLSWSPQQAPTATDRALLTGGGNHNRVLDVGANNVTWYQMFPNNNGPVTINGTGTITLAIPRDANGNGNDFAGDPNNPEWAIFTAGGEAFGGVDVPSIINPNVVANSYIETNGSHSLTFNGDVTALTVQAFAGTKVVFNGDVTFTAGEVPDSRFITGNDTFPSVTFNGNVNLSPWDLFPATGFGIRNQMTVNLGPNATLSSNITPTGWGEVNLYNGSKLRLFGNNRLGADNDLWSRGANSILTNTLDFNGFSDSVEFLGTAGDSTMVVDFGAAIGANSLIWTATHQTNGQYSIVNFQSGADTLTLGSPGNGFWFETGNTTAEEAILAKIKINGIAYAPFNAATTTPYWTVVNPAVSRNVQIFNGPNANFDGINGVNGNDFLIWQRNVGLTNQSNNANGDANRDGTVNGLDLAILKSQFGTNPTVTAAVGAVPEPATLSLVLVGLIGAGLLRQRRFAV